MFRKAAECFNPSSVCELSFSRLAPFAEEDEEAEEEAVFETDKGGCPSISEE